jgi:LuxR family transcriptional regulator, maltose regulon positive regulatory protein
VGTTLLTTKLFIPPVRPGIVPRPRLVEKLNAAMSNNFILISAPAGFGKTTLLSEWIHSNHPPIPIAWLSLEESENDPSSFWQYFIGALRTMNSSVGESSLRLLQSSQPSPIQATLSLLINDIAAISGDRFLVLDDYHFIQNATVHHGLEYFIDHMPPGMHLVIATRADPPLPLPHFRGKGIMSEIRTDDLRLTLEEATDLLSTLGAPVLPAEGIKALNAKAEGWAVGLKMAVISMTTATDIGNFVSDFAGSQRYVMDYLIEEVLDRQPENVREFLLKTSVLDRLNGSLCDMVTGGNNGNDMLLGLEKANLFLVPLDNSQQWYRYEHLFGELLRHRLEMEYGTAMVGELQRRASHWHEGNGFHESAISHAIAAHEWEMVISLISVANPVAAYGHEKAYGWLKQVPRSVLFQYPQACIYYGFAIGGAKPREVEAFLESYEHSASYAPALAGQVALVRTAAAANSQDPRIEEYAKQALALLPPEETALRMLTKMFLGIYLYFQGRYVEAEPVLVESCDVLNGTSEALLGLVFLVNISTLRGNLYRAEEMAKRAISFDERHPYTWSTHLWLGVVYLWWNNLEAAAAELERAAALNFSPSDVFHAYVWLTDVRTMQGDITAAAQALEKAEMVLFNGNPPTLNRASIAAQHVNLALHQEDSELVSRWLDEIPVCAGISTIAPAVMYLLLRRRGEALREQLKADYESSRKEDLCAGPVFVRIAQAVASSDPDEAMSFMSEALARARSGGFIRPLISWGTHLAPLLRRAISQGIEAEYARKLLTIIETEDRQRKARKREAAASFPVTDLLSGREMEVLRLLAAGSSNQDIAMGLVISLPTVKTHIRHIYNKLGVDGRFQAIARARDLKLI